MLYKIKIAALTTLVLTASVSIVLNLYLLNAIVFIGGGYTAEDRAHLQMIIDSLKAE